MIKKLEAVIFDYDGTILDTEKAYYEVMKELIQKKFNKKIEKMDYIHNVSGTSTDQCKKYVMEKYEITAEEYLEFEKEITVMMYDKFKEISILPYIEETLELLKENNIKVAIASNGYLEHIVDGLKLNNLFNYVDDIITKYDVANGKPSPDVYLLAAERLGVDIKNCIAVEDSRPGAKAAVASGAYLVLQTNDITKHFNYDDVDYKKRDCNLYELIKNFIEK